MPKTKNRKGTLITWLQIAAFGLCAITLTGCAAISKVTNATGVLTQKHIDPRSLGPFPGPLAFCPDMDPAKATPRWATDEEMNIIYNEKGQPLVEGFDTGIMGTDSDNPRYFSGVFDNDYPLEKTPGAPVVKTVENNVLQARAIAMKLRKIRKKKLEEQKNKEKEAQRMAQKETPARPPEEVLKATIQELSTVSDFVVTP